MIYSLDELRRLEREATAGPWHYDGIAYVFGPQDEMVADACHSCAGVRIRGVGARLPMADNADLIAALRNACPAILEDAAKVPDLVRALRWCVLRLSIGGENRLTHKSVCIDVDPAGNTYEVTPYPEWDEAQRLLALIDGQREERT